MPLTPCSVGTGYEPDCIVPCEPPATGFQPNCLQQCPTDQPGLFQPACIGPCPPNTLGPATPGCVPVCPADEYLGPRDVGNAGLTVRGCVYIDPAMNGKLDAQDPSQDGVVIFVDLNNNTLRDPGETYTTSSQGGYFTMNVGVIASTSATLREVVPSGFAQTGPRPSTDAWSRWFYYKLQPSTHEYDGFNFGNFAACLNYNVTPPSVNLTAPSYNVTPPSVANCTPVPDTCQSYGQIFRSCDPFAQPPPCTPGIPGILPHECLPVPHPISPGNSTGSSGDQNNTCLPATSGTLDSGADLDSCGPVPGYDWPNTPFMGGGTPALCACGESGGGGQGAAGTVNLYTGEMKLQVTPAVLPVSRGFEFAFNMTYRSRSPNATAGDNMFGPRWDYSYGAYIHDAGGPLVLHPGNGQAIPYTSITATVWVPPPGFYNQITVHNSTAYDVLEQHGMVRTFTKASTLYPYDGSAQDYKLTGITDPNGNHQRVWPSHAVMDTQGRLIFFGELDATTMGWHRGSSETDPYYMPPELPGWGIAEIEGIKLLNSDAIHWTSAFNWATGYWDIKNTAGDLVSYPGCTVACMNYTDNAGVCDDHCGADGYSIQYRELAHFNDMPADGNPCLGGVAGFGGAGGGWGYDVSRDGSPCRMTNFNDPMGTSLETNSYDGRDRVVSQDGIHKYGFQYDDTACHTTYWNEGHNRLDYYCLDHQRPLTVKMVEYTNRHANPDDPPSYSTYYTYNQNGEVTAIHWPRGNLDEYVYDDSNSDVRAQGNVICHIQDPGSFLVGLDGEPQLPIITKYTYNATFQRVASVVDARESYPGFMPPQGQVTPGRFTSTYDYDEHGNLIHAAYPESRSESWTYNTYGQVRNHTDVLGTTENFTYFASNGKFTDAGDAEGYLAQHVQDITGFRLVTTYTRDRDGNPTSVTDPRGNTITLEFAPGCILKKAKAPNPLDYTAQIDHNAARDVVETKQQGDKHGVDHVEKHLYDAAGDEVVTEKDATRPDGPGATSQDTHPITFHCYDQSGNVLLERRPESANGHQYWDLTATIYDERNRAVWTTRGDIPANWWAQGMRLAPGCGAPFVPAPGTVGDLGASCVDSSGGHYSGYGLNAAGQPPDSSPEMRGTTSTDAKPTPILPTGCPAVSEENIQAGLYVLAHGSVQSTIVHGYDANGNLAWERDGMGNYTRYLYDGYDRLIATVDALGGHSEKKYDPVSNVIEERFCGELEYNAALAPLDGVPVWGPLTSTVTCLRTAQTQLYTRTTSNHDDANRVYETNVLFQDLATGLPLTDGPLAPNDGYVTTRTEFDAAGHVTKTTNDNNHASTTKYDALGRTNQTVDAAGNKVNTTYDKGSNPVKTTQTWVCPLSASICTGIDSRISSYDELNRQNSTTDNVGAKTNSTLNAAGQAVNTTSPLGHYVKHFVDALGRTIMDQYDSSWYDVHDAYVTLTFSTSVTYTSQLVNLGEYNVTRLTFSNGTVMRFKEVPSISTSGGLATISGEKLLPHKTLHKELLNVTYDYDADGRLVGMIDGLHQRTDYLYDALGRKTRETAPDGTHQDFVYDANDRVTTFSDPNGNVVESTYDALGRTLTIHLATAGTGVVGSTDQAFTYDPMGHQITATDSNAADPTQTHIVATTYDSLGNVLTETEDGATATSTHDGLGHRTSLTYPSGWKASYAFDALERMASISTSDAPTASTLVMQYKYEGKNRVSSRTFGTGAMVESFDYDAAGRLASLAYSAAGVGFFYAYDADGRLTSKQKTHQGTDSESYNVDALGRLRSFNRGDLPVADTMNQKWDLDRANNWASNAKTTASAGYKVAARTHSTTNEIVNETIGGISKTLTYDANGNLLSDGSREFKWDFKNRLREVKNVAVSPSIVVGKYEYDAGNRRVKAENPHTGVTVTFFSDGMNEVQETSTLPGELVKQYLYGSGVDELVLQDNVQTDATTGAVTLSNQAYFVQDEQMSVYGVTDDAGVLLEGYEYDPYGHATVYTPATGSSVVTFTAADSIMTSGFAKSAYQYTGRRYDSASGLLYYRSRYMDSDLGRFISKDTIGVWGDKTGRGNSYGYVSDTPGGHVDPGGTQRLPFGMGYGSPGSRMQEQRDWWEAERMEQAVHSSPHGGHSSGVCGSPNTYYSYVSRMRENSNPDCKILIDESYNISERDLVEASALYQEFGTRFKGAVMASIMKGGDSGATFYFGDGWGPLRAEFTTSYLGFFAKDISSADQAAFVYGLPSRPLVSMPITLPCNDRVFIWGLAASGNGDSWIFAARGSDISVGAPRWVD
ncbi:MAG: RHS repeat-associated core domain-containing protein [bacterium]